MTREQFYGLFLDANFFIPCWQEYGVYFIIDGQGKIKIGKTNNLARRLIDLQTNNPNRLRVAGWIGCRDNGMEDNEYSKLETSFHKMFSFCHIKGEWYEDGPVLQYLFTTSGLIYPPYYVSQWWFAKKGEKQMRYTEMRDKFWKDYSRIFLNKK